MDNNFMMLLPMLMGGNNSNMGDILKMMGGQNQDPMMTAMMSMLNKNKGNTNPQQNINDINPNDNTHQNNINDNNGVKTDANTVIGNGFAPIKDISGETIMELMRIFLNLKTN